MAAAPGMGADLATAAELEPELEPGVQATLVGETTAKAATATTVLAMAVVTVPPMARMTIGAEREP